nr:ankyrin repeat-containing protein [Colletotrichum truncatum]KAF6796660.1 ankyrin repeat-containing protein [Colletotrichum truncatum]
MPHDTFNPTSLWANSTGLVVAIIVCLMTAAFSRWFVSPAPKTPKARKSLTFRVDDIPNDDYDDFDQKLISVAKQDPALHDIANTFVRRSLSRKDKTSFCATVSATTDLSGKELCVRLSQAGKSYRYSFSCDFSGITPLFEDENGAAVDIVAVPGLGSHALGSWKSPTGDEVWLRDFLPKDIPNIRVLLYGYDTSLPGSLSKQSIQDLGKMLLEHIAAFRANDGTTRRPLIFIGHSLGGLLIKEALIRAGKPQSEAIADLSFACYALLFFGVPNLGLRNDQLRTLVEGQPNEALIQDLLVDNDSEPSTFLKRLADQFSESCKNQYRVISFFERMLSPTLMRDNQGNWQKNGEPSLLVTEKSSTATDLVAVADQDSIPLNTDHSGLVKYSSKSQGEYTIVRMRIGDCVKKAEKIVTERFDYHSFDQAPSKNREECMKSLAFEELHSRHNGIELAAHGTCQWLLEHKNLLEWKRFCKDMLWIKGKPGSGKSTLLKFALEKVPPLCDAKTVVISFFFHGRGYELQRSLLGLFRSLLYQLLDKVPGALSDLIDDFNHYCITMGEPGIKWNWHIGKLKSFFRSSLMRILERRSVLLFIDALDECGEESAVELIEYLTDLLSDCKNMKFTFGVIFSCRHFPIIEIKNGWTIVPEEENDVDIDTYVQRKITADQNSSIQSLITSRAQGVFMWARIVVDQVNRMKRRGEPAGEIEREIKRTPKELNALYDELLRNVEDSEVTIRLMQWVCFSTRPLTTYELPWAMAIDPYNSDQTLGSCQQSDEFITEDKMFNRITSLSCGLAEIVPGEGLSGGLGIIQFIHQSVKDHMVEQGLSRLNRTESIDGLLAPNTNGLLCLICIGYFNMIMSSRLGPFDKDYATKFPFLEYATTSIVPHLKFSESGVISPEVFLKALHWPSNSLVELWVSANNNTKKDLRERLEDGANLVHITAKFELVNLLSEILLGDCEVSIDYKDNSGRTPLFYAAGEGNEKTMRALLETGKVDADSRDNEGRTPLSWAAQGGLEAVVKALLETGKVDADSRDNDGQTPLSWAAIVGHEAVVQTLLVTGKVDADSRENEGRTPLSWAAQGGFEAVVKTLLETGKVNADSRDNDGRTPLSLAAEEGHEAVVKTLLETSKVDVNSRDNGDQTPLSLAAEEGHEAVVKTLLETGKVNADSRDNGGQTPLSWAAIMGHEAVVKALLETGKVDVNSRDSGGQTPLSWAAIMGHEAVVKTLLEKDKVNIDSKDKKNRTPLLWASRNGYQMVVEVLLETGRVDIESRDTIYGQTPLSWAAENGHEAVVKTLLGTGIANVESKDYDGRTPLLWAAINGHQTVVEILLETGKAEIELRDDMGRTSLSWASAKGHEETVLTLVNTRNININSEDTDGFTPLMWAGWKCHKEVFRILFRAERFPERTYTDGVCFQASRFMSMDELDKFAFEIGYDFDDDFFGLKWLFGISGDVVRDRRVGTK